MIPGSYYHGITTAVNFLFKTGEAMAAKAIAAKALKI